MEENFTKAEKGLLLNVKAAYDRIGTISGVARELNLQSWRVKKYLRRGHRYGLFTYDKYYRVKNRHKFRPGSQKTLMLRLLSRYGTPEKVYEKTGFSEDYIYGLLGNKFKAKSIKKLKYNVNSRLTVANAKRLKIQKFKELYDQLGTLEKVAQKLGLTRERVRQVLADGLKYKIYDYLPTKVGPLRFKELKDNLKREDLIKEIKMLMTISKICLRYNITDKEFKKLLRHFNIDYEEYLKLARAGRYVERYSGIVDILGHHPTTTEMSSRPYWRATWAAIDRYWGNMDNFRSEFGIEKPKMSIHPNTIASLKRLGDKMKQRKKEKKELVFNLIKQEGPIPSKIIRDRLNTGSAVTSTYLQELIRENLIRRTGTGNRVKYIANQQPIP